jgi:hypothetical protein
MTNKTGKVSTGAGCGILLLCCVGILVVLWIGTEVRSGLSRPSPEEVKRQIAIEVCSGLLVQEHMPGLKGVEGRRPRAETLATVAKQGDTYTVSWGIGDAWCKVNLVTTDGGVKSGNPDVSWRH